MPALLASPGTLFSAPSAIHSPTSSIQHLSTSTIMPNGNNGSSGNTGGGYNITSQGTNSQGNHYDNRDYGASAPNQNSYHYSNSNGSYYYSNPNGSTYYNDGQGKAAYNPPGNGK